MSFDFFFFTKQASRTCIEKTPTIKKHANYTTQSKCRPGRVGRFSILRLGSTRTKQTVFFWIYAIRADLDTEFTYNYDSHLTRFSNYIPCPVEFSRFWLEKPCNVLRSVEKSIVHLFSTRQKEPRIAILDSLTRLHILRP